jgi:hypothetical protein
MNQKQIESLRKLILLEKSVLGDVDSDDILKMIVGEVE